MKGAIVIEGHIQGLANTRSLGRLGVPVVVMDTRRTCVARFSKYCQHFYTCPEYASDALADFLIQLAEEQQFSGWMIFPSNDHAVITLARHRDRLAQHYRIMGPDQETARRIYDKLELMSIAALVNVPVPLTFEAGSKLLENLSLPCIIKGRQGLTFYKTFGTKALICNTLTELKNHLEHPAIRSNPELAMIQEIISSPESHHTISVATFSAQGSVKAWWMGQKLREHPWKFGTATLTESIIIEELKPYTEALMQALEYTGVTETEFLYDANTGQYKLIEINARTWLWCGHAAACGVDFASLAWLHTMNEPVHWPNDYITGLKWRNFYTDLFYGIKAMARGQIRFSTWIKQTKGRKVSAVWNKSDPVPFLVLTAMLPLIALQRTNP
jgi:predicted ATP-grasp superfamily ATP-dependent carboligase